MSETPLISVLIAAHNEARFIETSIRSVLAQTIPGIEVLVVDDASTDGTADIVGRIRDSRIRVIRNSSNMGLAASLNRGLPLCRGKYIARLDGDDISLPERLKEQSAYLEGHSEIVILGTYARSISEDGRPKKILRRPRYDCQVRWMSLLANPFLHPSVMLRTETLRRHSLEYREDLRTGQDYALWAELLRKGKGENLPQVLIHYRLREGLSSKMRGDQLLNSFAISHQVLQECLPEAELSMDAVRELGTLVHYRDALSPELKAKWNSCADSFLELFLLFTKKFGDSERLRSHFIDQCLTLGGSYPKSGGLLNFAWRNSRKNLPFLFRFQFAVLKSNLNRLR
jgi:hypothetical protein